MSRNNRAITNKDVFQGLGIKGKNQLRDEGDPLEEARKMPLEQIVPNPNQPRKKTNPQKDEELAIDIGERGVLQPIIVRPLNEGKFQIIAGERRWRAAKAAGLEEVPVIINEVDDQEAQFISLVENLQRVDLEPEDEAVFFRKLAEEYNLTNRRIAKLINRSHSYVNDRIRLIDPNAGLDGPDEKEEQTKTAPSTEIVRERAAPVPKTWRYRPQTFQRFREYVTETIENADKLKDRTSRETIMHEISSLKEELARLEKLFHVKTK